MKWEKNRCHGEEDRKDQERQEAVGAGRLEEKPKDYTQEQGELNQTPS